MFYSLKNRLWLTNILIIMMTVMLIILSINFFAVHEFNIYKTNDLDKTYQDIYEIVAEQYQDNTWDLWLLEEVGADILENRKILIALYDNSGQTLYDSAGTSSLPASPPRGMTGRMQNWGDWGMHANRSVKGYNQKQFTILSDGGVAGTLVLASTQQYDDNDIVYLRRITQIVIIVGVIATGFTILITNLFTNIISRQISNITKAAGDISNGNYGQLVDEKTKISELRQLILALNNLSGNLEHHETLRKKMTQDIAHELRTPISTIQGNLEAVLDGIWEMDQEKIRTLYEESQRLSRLVSALNNLSKYENGVLNKASFDISELLQYVSKQFEAGYQEKKIQVSIDVKPVVLYADRDKLIQVFINLIANAVKFTPEHGRIEICGFLREDGKHLRLSIRDTGTGISPEDIPYIFERFYRAEKSRNRQNGGAGIGLAIVKAVVDAHGGTIRAESEPGIFTEFILELPLQR